MDEELPNDMIDKISLDAELFSYNNRSTRSSSSHNASP